MSSFYGGGVAAGAGSGSTSSVGIANIEINNNKHLIVYLTDGSRKDLGKVAGATFTPYIIDGILSWANDQGLQNPESFDFNKFLEEQGELWHPVDSKTEEDVFGEEVQYWSPI